MGIAFPTDASGGLSVRWSAHFGHCDIFTVIDMSAEGDLFRIETIINAGHKTGGCMTPVTLVNKAKVDAIVVTGLGMRPMHGFSQLGITVYIVSKDQCPDVESIISHVKDKKRVAIHGDLVCNGSGNCHQQGEKRKKRGIYR